MTKRLFAHQKPIKDFQESGWWKSDGWHIFNHLLSPLYVDWDSCKQICRQENQKKIKCYQHFYLLLTFWRIRKNSFLLTEMFCYYRKNRKSFPLSTWKVEFILSVHENFYRQLAVSCIDTSLDNNLGWWENSTNYSIMMSKNHLHHQNIFSFSVL